MPITPTPYELRSNKKIRRAVRQEKRDNLFVEVMAKTNSPLQAMLASEPALADRRQYAGVKAQRQMKRPEIREKLDKELQKMSKKAIKRIDKMLESDSEQIASLNAWKVIEHNVGTPVKRNLNVNVKSSIEDALFE